MLAKLRCLLWILEDNKQSGSWAPSGARFGRIEAEFGFIWVEAVAGKHPQPKPHFFFSHLLLTYTEPRDVTSPCTGTNEKPRPAEKDQESDFAHPWGSLPTQDIQALCDRSLPLTTTIIIIIIPAS